MNLTYKDYYYLTFILLLPFTCLLSILYLKSFGSFHNSFFKYLIILLFIIVLITFVIATLYTLDDVVKEEDDSTNKSLKLSLIITFSIFYIPIHYINKYFHNYKKYIMLVILIQLISIFYLYISSYNYAFDYLTKNADIAIAKNSREYLFDDNHFYIELSYNYLCEDLGEYVLSCSTKDDSNFIGAYSYVISDYGEKELNDIYNFHLNQTRDYIKEEKYEIREEEQNNINIFNYDDRAILITSIDYDLDKDLVLDKRLIIIYETNFDESNIIEFNEVLDKIKVNENYS